LAYIYKIVKDKPRGLQVTLSMHVELVYNHVSDSGPVDFLLIKSIKIKGLVHNIAHLYLIGFNL